jgi:hypothetical protein
MRRPSEFPLLADSCLMHRSITACCRKAAVNGGNRPFADDGPGKTSGRLLVLHCGMMFSDVDQQLGKLKFYH